MSKRAVHRWVEVNALLALDEHGWVRGIVIPDGFNGVEPTYWFADSISGDKYRLSASVAQSKKYVSLRILEERDIG